MMKKNYFMLLLAAIVTLPVFGSRNTIQVRKKGSHTGSRTEQVVNASINDLVLTVSFSDVTASGIVVYDATAPDSILFSQNYAPAYSAQANLNSLSAGEYTVDIYAFDEWWTGDFEIE
jgi:hypothetical protein